MPVLFGTDCPAGAGGAGSPVINTDLKNPILLGIQVAVTESEDEANEELKEGRPIIKPFSISNGWHTTVRAISTGFVSAIITAASSDKQKCEQLFALCSRCVC